MIDIESDVFDIVADRLRADFDGIFVTGEETDLPARFPAASIVEKDNSVYSQMSTTNIENAVTVMYEVDAYSDKVGYKKSEAKAIIAAADEEMIRLGFERLSVNPISNLQEATIYRIKARYRAVVDKDLWIYQE